MANLKRLACSATLAQCKVLDEILMKLRWHYVQLSTQSVSKDLLRTHKQMQLLLKGCVTGSSHHDLHDGR